MIIATQAGPFLNLSLSRGDTSGVIAGRTALDFPLLKPDIPASIPNHRKQYDDRS
jgi:hypothetical protein